MKRILGTMALAAPAAILSGASEPPTGDITVTITEMRSNRGVVRACMTTDPRIFPKCRKDPESHRIVIPADKAVSFTFSGVEPGRYAIALLHDENANGKADRVLGMMPKEGFGFSRDAGVHMGPPKFESAAFDFDGETTSQTIRMRYML